MLKVSERTVFTAIICSLLATLIALVMLYRECPEVDPEDRPHETDCSMFYRYEHGSPKVVECPPGLHFNAGLQGCDLPINAGCAISEPITDPPLNDQAVNAGSESKCQPLINGEGGVWQPPTCTQRSGQPNERCQIECATGFEHSGGTAVSCGPEGWVGQRGAEMPTCFVIADLGVTIVDQINETLGGRDASFLFILDESGSVSTAEFDMEIRFIKSLVAGFPLSEKRAGGVITFSSNAAVDIRMTETNTCSFLMRAGQIRYSGGGTDILSALKMANQEIKTYHLHKLTLVLLVTDGLSSTDPTVAANELKANGNILFTVGVAGYSPKQLIPLASLDKKGKPLFHGIDSFDIFKRVAEYFETKYNPNAVDCGLKP